MRSVSLFKEMSNRWPSVAKWMPLSFASANRRGQNCALLSDSSHVLAVESLLASPFCAVTVAPFLKQACRGAFSEYEQSDPLLS